MTRQQNGTSPSLPLIDISPFLVPDPDPTSKAHTIAALRDALHSHGFFYLSNHSLPSTLTSEVISLAHTFFTTSTPEQKALLQRRNPGDGLGDGARGYQKIGENVSAGHRDWHEAIDWYAPFVDGEGVAMDIASAGSDPATANADSNGHTVNGTPITTASNQQPKALREPPYSLLEGPNLFPTSSALASFRSTYDAYVSACRELGTAVLHAMGQALSLHDPTFFASAVRDSFWVMRAIGYPPLDSALAATGGVSCGSHTDYGCLTLLLDDGTPGALQVFLRGEKEGEGHWVDVQPVEGALVVNVGDMVERWTGGEVRSTRHRVVHTGKGFRVSVPFFLEPGRDVVVRCLEEFREGMEARLKRGEVGSEVTEEVKYWDHLVGKIGGNFYGGED